MSDKPKKPRKKIPIHDGVLGLAAIRVTKRGVYAMTNGPEGTDVVASWNGDPEKPIRYPGDKKKDEDQDE